jgi:hypothetical protein
MSLTLALPAAWAQTGAGTISGTVQDINKGVVPEAEVTVTQTRTNISHKTQTSKVGIYYFGALPPGPYKLVVEKQGFKTWEGTLDLDVGQDAVVDSVLQVGDVKTVVEVKGAAPHIEREEMQVGDVRTFEQIQQLPLDGREITNLYALTPGVEGGGSARVNGLKVGSMGISLDGVSQRDRFGGGQLRVNPGLDTIQEFRIETVGSNARYEDPSTVVLSTRSGTNQLHGSVFETHRNNSGGLEVRRRQDAPGAPHDKYIRNEFGGNAGGPIYLPHLYDGRNKAFFFASFEGSRLRQSNVVEATVPTDAMWNGDLSHNIDTCTGNLIKIYDPTTTNPATGQRQQFAGNIIPPNQISSFAKELASLTARPSTSDPNPNDGSPNFFFAYPEDTTINRLTIKEDQRISEKDSLSVRYSRDTSNDILTGGRYGYPVTPSMAFGTQIHNPKINDVGINYNRNITGSLLSQLTLAVSRSNHHQGTLADFIDWTDKLGLPNPLGATGWPTLCASDLGVCYCWDVDNRIQQALTNVTLEEAVTWVKGKHTIQFGGKARHEWNNVRELQQAQGSDSFCASWTALYCPAGCPGFCAGINPVPDTGSGFASVLLGIPTTLRNHFNHGYFYFRQTEGSLYANDKWKVSPRLTLTLGLRWDKWTPYTEKYNRIVTVDLATIPNLFQVVTPGNSDIYKLPGIPSSAIASWSNRGLTYTNAAAIQYPSNLFSSVSHDFGPRAGIAFQINSKTVLRGGYGEYFWPMPLSQILQAARVNPPLDLRYTYHLDNIIPTANYTLVSAPSPNDYVGKAMLDISGIFPISPNAQEPFIWHGRHWRDSHARSWNVTLEHEFTRAGVLRFSYIGTHGLDMEQEAGINNQEPVYRYVTETGQLPPHIRDQLRVNPNWSLVVLNHTGFSNTHSGQVQFERKLSSGLGFQIFYTYTRSLTTTDAGGFSDGAQGINDTTGGGMVPENLQLWGNQNLTYDQRLRLVYYNSTSIPPHRITFNGIYDLPFGRGKRFGRQVSGPLNQVIGGWQVATIGTWNHGFWEGINTGLYQFGNPRLSPDQRLTMDIFGARQRLWFRGNFNPASATNVSGGDLLALVPADPTQRVVHPLGPNCQGQYTNGNIGVTLANGGCFNASTGGFYNYSPRGNIIGPGSWNTDISAFKNFRFKERGEVRFTMDFFNAFNHPIDPTPSSSTGLQPLNYQTNDPRRYQLSLRLSW